MAPERTSRPGGSSLPGMRNSALATAALTSVALFSQPAGATPATGDDGPSREEVRQRVNTLYDQAETATGNYNATRATKAGSPGRRTGSVTDNERAARAGSVTAEPSDTREPADPALAEVARQWFEVARAKLGPTVPALLPTDRKPVRPAAQTRPARPAAGLTQPEPKTADPTVPELTAKAAPALPSGSGTRQEAPQALPASATKPGQSSLQATKERNRHKLTLAREQLADHAATLSTPLTAIESRPAENTWATEPTHYATEANWQQQQPTTFTTADSPITTSQSFTTGVPSDTGGYPLAVGQAADTGGYPVITGTLADSGSYPLATEQIADTGGYPVVTGTPADTGSYPVATGQPADTGTYPLNTGQPTNTGNYPHTTGQPTDTGANPIITATPADTGNHPLPTGQTTDTGTYPLNTSQPTNRGSYPLPTGQPANPSYPVAPGQPITASQSLTTGTPTDTGYSLATSQPATASRSLATNLPTDTGYSPTTGQPANTAHPVTTTLPTNPNHPLSDQVTSPGHDTKAAKVLTFARAQIGRPCVWGAAGPGSYDCSGLTQAAWKAVGVELPRTTQAQASVGTPVALSGVLPGDLLFFFDDLSHVGLYVGNGMMVHAPSPGAYIREESIFHAGESAIRGAIRPA